VARVASLARCPGRWYLELLQWRTLCRTGVNLACRPLSYSMHVGHLPLWSPPFTKMSFMGGDRSLYARCLLFCQAEKLRVNKNNFQLNHTFLGKMSAAGWGNHHGRTVICTISNYILCALSMFAHFNRLICPVLNPDLLKISILFYYVAASIW
jgi:hypothetical protein